MSLTGLAHGHWPIGIYGMSDAIPPGLFRFDASRPDHLRPLHRFVCDELGELGRRAYKWRVAQVRDPRLDLGISEGRVDLIIDLFNDLAGCIPRRSHPQPD